MSSNKIVFVTGASGFLASHIIYQLIQKGYRVRATARPKKVAALQALYKEHPVEIVEAADVATSNFEQGLVGVYAVIHTATAVPGRADAETTLKTAIEGTLNVVRQAEKAGVKKIVVTSSLSAVAGAPDVKDDMYTADHWSPVTKEMASISSQMAYTAAKKYAELALWEWAEAHPDVDVTTLAPPYLYGPFAPISLPLAPGDWVPFSTNTYISYLISPTGEWPLIPVYLDIRDTARAHIDALDAPAGVQGRKRILITSPHTLVFKDVLELISKARPELKERLIKTPEPEYMLTKFNVDYGRIEEVLGIKKDDFHTVEQTFLDTIDSILKVEEDWKKQGYTNIEVPHYDIN